MWENLLLLSPLGTPMIFNLNKLNKQISVKVRKGYLINPILNKSNKIFRIRVSKRCLLKTDLKILNAYSF